MKPLHFSTVNQIIAKDQPEYLPLPAYFNDKTGEVITCWSLTWRERVMILFKGRLWLRQLAFGQKLQPQLPQAYDPWLDLKFSKEVPERVGG